MLVLSRVRDTAILLGQDIVVTARDFGAGGAVLEIAFPPGTVLRTPQGVIAGERDDCASTGSPVAKRMVYLKPDETLHIGDRIGVTVVSLFAGLSGPPCRVKLGFDAPPDVVIMREELQAGGKADRPAAPGEAP